MYRGWAFGLELPGTGLLEVYAHRFRMTFGVLKNLDFRRLWLGQAASQLGDSLYFLIFLFMVDRITKNPAMVGTVAAIQALPFLILGPWAGALADRMDRKRLMVMADFASAGLLVVFTVGLFYWQTPPIWAIFTVAGLLSTVNVFFAPAKGAAIPRLVPQEQLMEANALSATTQNFMPLIGLGVGASALGALEQVAPTLFFQIAVMLNGLSFLVSGFFILKLPSLIPNRDEASEQHPLRDALDGLRFIQSEPVLRTTLVVQMLLSFFVSPFMLVYLAINRQWFGGAYWTVATFEASFVGAMVVMSIAMTRIRIRKIGMASVWGTLLIGIFIGLMGVSPYFWPFLIYNILCGLALPFIQIPMTTYIQTVVPDAMMGRVQSVLAMSAMVVVPFSTWIAGVTLGQIGAKTMFFIMGIGMVVTALYALTVRQYRAAQLVVLAPSAN